VDRCRTLVREIVEEMGLLRRKTDEQRRDLKQQLADVERRMAIWHEAFETHAESADVVLPRLRELKARRDELISTLAKVVPLTSPPNHLYAETTIARFQQTIRDLFLGTDQGLAKNYLRFLVERIDVSGNELTVRGKAGATVALLAAGPEPSRAHTVNPAEVVLTSAGGWLRL